LLAYRGEGAKKHNGDSVVEHALAEEEGVEERIAVEVGGTEGGRREGGREGGKEGGRTR